MNKGLKKLVVLIEVGLIFGLSLFAENATVTFVRGKVEVQRQDGNWYPLDVGDQVSQSETISTGFYSDIKLEYKSSIIAFGALTRVTLENLSSTSDKDNVSLYLNTGAVRSKVNHTKEKRVSYVVKTPVAVASVRGTDFTITAGGSITCNEGAVVVFPNIDVNAKSSNKEAESEEESEESAEESDETSESVTAVVMETNNEVESDMQTEGESNAGDYGPATSTTPAKAIASDAPAGAIVVGRSQTVSISTTGTTETPITNASKKSQQAKAVVTTAATQEAEIVGSSTAPTQASTKEIAGAAEDIIVKTGKITAEIVLQD